MNRVLAVCVTCLVLSAVSGIRAQTTAEGEKLLEAARRTAVIEGDLKKAIDQYRRIADRFKKNQPSIAASALLQMAQYQETVGQAQARETYERIVKDFRSQTETVKAAQARLATLQAPSTAAVTYRGLQQIAQERGGAISPDGRYLYVSQDVRIPIVDLVSKKTILAHPEPGTAGPADRAGALLGGPDGAFSPDSQQFAYFLANGPFQISTVVELRTIRLPGDGKPGTLVFRSQEYIWIVPFGWSPDGREVFVMLTRPDRTNVIAAIPLATGVPRPVKSLDWRWPGKLSLSPDGRHIVYDAPEEKQSTNRELYILSVADGRETPLVTHPDRDAAPTWVPKGNAVVFLRSDRSGRAGLMMIQVSDGRPQGTALPLRLNMGSANPALIWPVGFSRNGSFYFQNQAPDSIGAILVSEFDLFTGTVGPETRLQGLGGGDYAPAYSPDSKRLAYFSQKGGGFRSDPTRTRGFLTLVIRSLASSDKDREIQTPFTVANSLRWLEDGRSLALVGATDDEHYQQRSLYKIDVETGRILFSDAVTTFHPTNNDATISADGSRLYYVDARTCYDVCKVVVYDVETRRTTDLFEGHLSNNWQTRLALSRDGRQLAFVAGAVGSPSTLHILPVSGGTPRVLSLPNPTGRPMRVLDWSDDATRLLVQVGGGARGAGRGGRGGLWWVPIDGGPAREIDSSVPILAIRPDGRETVRTVTVASVPAASGFSTWVAPGLSLP